MAMADDPREQLGRLVHEMRLACEAERAAAEGRMRFLLGSWEERSDHQRELDMRIGEAVAAAERERIAQLAADRNATYPLHERPGLITDHLPFAELIRKEADRG
jgi:hypothetical protein